MKAQQRNLEAAITLLAQEIVFGKNSDIGEAVANRVVVENKRGKEKSSKKRRMEVKSAQETKLKRENAMRQNAKLRLIANGGHTVIGVHAPNLAGEDFRLG